MNILIDIGHPAHVHLFKNLAIELQRQHNIILFTVRSGEKEAELLNILNFNYRIIGKKKKGILKKFFGLFIFSLRIYRIAKNYKIGLFLSHGSMYAGYASLLMNKPHIALEDTGNLEQIRFSKPVSNVILSPESLQVSLGKKQLKYKGFHELAYLHPSKFKPNPEILKKLNLNNKENLILLRFSSWSASHDFNVKGLSMSNKRTLIDKLSNYGKILISSEATLPLEFEKYEIKISPEELHHLLNYISLYIGEGATTASECVMLGKPAIYYNPKILHGVLQSQANYGLLFHFYSFEGILEKAIAILTLPDRNNIFYDKRSKLLSQNINLSDFLIWFVINYPQSETIFRKNYEHQFEFK